MIPRGLNSKEVAESRQKHGANTLTQIPPDPLWKKILEGFKDPMIMILLVALIVQVVLFFLKQAEWFEPVGILIAILIANGVASISESSQESKASALKAEEEAKETAKIVGLAALKYGDLSNQATKDYVFDIDRFISFEGNTGPYVLYTIARINSILKKYLTIL